MLNLHIDPHHAYLPPTSRRASRLLAALGLATLLAACGGGDEIAVTAGSPVAVIVNGQTVSSTVTPALRYAVGGGLSGMAAGQSLVLQDASGLTASFSANGTYTLLASVPSGTPYNLSVKTQPLGQSCSISNGAGSISSASITNVQVACTSPFLRLLAGNVGGRGSSDGLGAAARFNGPGYVAFDSQGNAFVTDWGNHTVRKITPAGLVSTIAGSPTVPGFANGAGSDALFNGPQGIALDSADNVYVADSDNAVIRKITPAGLVSTFAGSPNNFGVVEGTATARFSGLQGLAIDTADNIYAAQASTGRFGIHSIRKITPAGLASTLAGSSLVGNTNGTGTTARFSAPIGVAVDGAGNVYVAETNGHSIRKITAAGLVSTLAGSSNGFSGYENGTDTVARFANPQGVAVDSTGNVYVADTRNNSIRKIAPDGQVSTLAGVSSPARSSGSADGQGTDARFNGVFGIGLDRAGNLYAADGSNHTVRKITPAGLVSTFAGAASVSGFADGLVAAAQFDTPRGIAADSSGNAYVVDSGNNVIRKITPAGQVSTIAGSSTADGSDDGAGTAALFLSPRGMAIDSAGNVYVADNGNKRIRKITPAGLVSNLAGSTNGYADGAGAAAQFGSVVEHVAVDSAGNVYVSDSSNFRIRKITPAGLVSTLAGSSTRGNADGTGALAQFDAPQGIAVDDAGNVYVAEYFNHTIRKISPAGVVTTLAGSNGLSGTADGAGSAARFNNPSSLAIDSAGNLYVADTESSTIRKITPDGVVSTVLGVSGRNETSVGSLPKLIDGAQGLSITGSTLYITTRQGVVVTTLP